MSFQLTFSKGVHSGVANSVLLLFTVVTVTGPSTAQIRPDQPSVIKPIPTQSGTTPATHSVNLKRALATASNPRIVLYWNALLSPATRSIPVKTELHKTNESQFGDRSEESIAGARGAAKFESFFDEAKKRVSVERYRTFRHGLRSGLKADPNLTSQIRNAFQREFSRAGADLLNRHLLVRQFASPGLETTIDPLQHEIQALTSLADWAIQVLFLKDKGAALGFGIDVQVIDVKTGAVLVSFYTAEQRAPVTVGQWRAGEAGFEYVTGKGRVFSPREIGVQLVRRITHELESS